MQTTLENIWCNPQNLFVKEIDAEIFQFSMKKIEDHKRILKGNPWNFRNSWLILQEWDDITSLGSLEFSKTPIWVQIWGLPTNKKTTHMGHKLGEKLRNVMEASIYEIPEISTNVKVKIILSIPPIMP